MSSSENNKNKITHENHSHFWNHHRFKIMWVRVCVTVWRCADACGCVYNVFEWRSWVKIASNVCSFEKFQFNGFEYGSCACKQPHIYVLFSLDTCLKIGRALCVYKPATNTIKRHAFEQTTWRWMWQKFCVCVTEIEIALNNFFDRASYLTNNQKSRSYDRYVVIWILAALENLEVSRNYIKQNEHDRNLHKIKWN